MKTTQAVINDVVWKACDTFRGTMNSSSYKDYILSMLFVKYLSDYYTQKQQELATQYGADEERIKRALERQKFVLDKTCTFDYLVANKEKDNFGEIINQALKKIEEDNKSKLDGIFRNIDFNNRQVLGETKERNSLLKNLIEDFNDSRLDLRPSMLEGKDIIGNSYEFLIKYFASDAGAKGGEFFTPSEVSTLLAKLVEAKEGETIYDPTCGSGSLLIKAAQEVGSDKFAIYGQEKNGQTQALCRMNMYLHDINDADIKWADTIRNPLHIEHGDLKKFDVVVANPPFSLDKWGDFDEESKSVQDSFNRFTSYATPPKSKGDYAFVLHMIHSMSDNGRMAIVLPHGVLFRGASEGKIRQKLLEQNLLDAVIGLPANLFYGTSIPACILVFKKKRSQQNILFIDASHDFVKGKNQNSLNDEQVAKIIATYRNRETIDKYSYLASLEEIKNNDYNLNIPRYVNCFEAEEEIDIQATKAEIAKIEAELAEMKQKMQVYLSELGL